VQARRTALHRTAGVTLQGSAIPVVNITHTQTGSLTGSVFCLQHQPVCLPGAIDRMLLATPCCTPLLLGLMTCQTSSQPLWRLVCLWMQPTGSTTPPCT